MEGLCVMREVSSVSDMLNVALPKGRLGDKVYALFERAGYGCPKLTEPGRKLIFDSPENGVRYCFVKPSDVAIYKDILLEYAPEVYELLDFGIGRCKMCVCGRPGFRDDPARTLRVATKFTRIARDYYAGLGRPIDMIHLNGSIELAPILGLSDVIVDIVETGATLRENGLGVLSEVCDISARLIANRVSCKFKYEAVTALAKRLSDVIEVKR